MFAQFGAAIGLFKLALRRLSRHPRQPYTTIAVLCTSLLLGSFTLTADSISLGAISFNTLIASAPGSAGVNDFEIDNFTGLYALAPDFPSLTDVSFANASLLLSLAGGGTETIALGNLAAGSYTPTTLQFSASIGFTSALFSASLSPTNITLSDGSSFLVTSSQISVDLSSALGAALTPDVDFALINVAADTTTNAVPEPNSVGLISAAAGIFLLLTIFRSLGR